MPKHTYVIEGRYGFGKWTWLLPLSDATLLCVAYQSPSKAPWRERQLLAFDNADDRFRYNKVPAHEAVDAALGR